ncbi:MAG: GntR family transcriptional regulator [Deltaproteobacteria bacterium]|nr:GntR family transcriptional regulator [Deltaproteobacteria bacterium]MBW2120382.1 GntR family transcriptional regulator [Deltaproteobacteria bacterium]
MAIFQKQQRTTLMEIALKEIRSAIHSGKLKPGDRIVEAELAKEMGISRFAIREAIRCLDKEGIVMTTPFKGSYVSRFDLKDLEELYSLRSALEELAVRILMEKLAPRHIQKLESVLKAMDRVAAKQKGGVFSEDMRFHRTICELSGHRRLLEMWLTLQDQVRVFIAMEEASYQERDRLLKVHYPVMEAIKSSDSPRAERCIREHIGDALEVIKGVLVKRARGGHQERQNRARS